MAYVLKCDKCGKILLTKTFKRDPININSFSVRFSGTYEPVHYDLCDDCNADVKEFFNSFDCLMSEEGDKGV